MKIAATLLALATFVAAPLAQAQITGKIGFVSTDKVLSESRAARQARAALDTEFKKRESEIASGNPATAERRGFAFSTAPRSGSKGRNTPR